jgi:hypothetical protein
MPFTIATNDTASVWAGCNLLSGIRNAVGDCKNKFNNLVNYRGEPYFPGTDRSTKGLDL